MLSSRLNSRGKITQHRFGFFPIDAGICDRNAVFQSTRAILRDTLLAFVQVGFNHDAYKSVFALSNLIRNTLRYFGLVFMVLVGVTVRAIHHDGGG